MAFRNAAQLVVCRIEHCNSRGEPQRGRVGARGRSDWTVKPDAMAICSLEAAFVRCRAFAGNFGVVIGRIFHMFSKLSYRILPRLFFRILPRLFFRVFPWLFFRGVSRILSTACIRLEKRHETSVESYAEMQSLGIPVHHQDGKAGNSTYLARNSEQTPITGSLRFRQITGENPVPAEARGKLDDMARAWLEWAKAYDDPL